MLLRTMGFAVILSALVGCTTGTNFTKPAQQSFVLGTTTRAQIQAVYGTPSFTASKTMAEPDGAASVTPVNLMLPARVSGTMSLIKFGYQDRSEVFLENKIKNKFIAFTFWNETLVAYSYFSDFAEDSSNFDQSRVSQLQKGVTTKDAAIQLLGQPDGRAIYPLLGRQGDEKLLYGHAVIEGDNISRKTLVLLFDPSGKLIDYESAQDSAPLPASPGVAPVPIFIPVHR